MDTFEFFLGREGGKKGKAAVAAFAIRDKRLYRYYQWQVGEKKITFEKYLEVRWDMSRRSAYRRIEAAEVREDLCPTGHIFKTLAAEEERDIDFEPYVAPLPESEHQARELAALKPEAQAEAWTRAITSATGLLR